MDPIAQEFAKYGAFALLAVLALGAMGLALKKVFSLYVKSQEKMIEYGEKALTTMQANTLAINTNTAAIHALGEVIKARRR